MISFDPRHHLKVTYLAKISSRFCARLCSKRFLKVRDALQNTRDSDAGEDEDHKDIGANGHEPKEDEHGGPTEVEETHRITEFRRVLSVACADTESRGKKSAHCHKVTAERAKYDVCEGVANEEFKYADHHVDEATNEPAVASMSTRLLHCGYSELTKSQP